MSAVKCDKCKACGEPSKKGAVLCQRHHDLVPKTVMIRFYMARSGSGADIDPALKAILEEVDKRTARCPACSRLIARQGEGGDLRRHPPGLDEKSSRQICPAVASARTRRRVTTAAIARPRDPGVAQGVRAAARVPRRKMKDAR